MTQELLDAEPPEDAPEVRNDDVDMESQMTPPADGDATEVATPNE